MPFPLLAMGIMSGIGALGGLLGNRSKTATSETKRTLDPAMQPMQNVTVDKLMSRLNSPMDVSGYRNNATDAINTAHISAPNRISEMMASRGFGQSGLVPKFMQQDEMGRLGELSRLEPSLMNLQSDRENQTLQYILGLLNQGRGETTTGNTPGNMAAGAFAGGVSGIGAGLQLDALNRMGR